MGDSCFVGDGCNLQAFVEKRADGAVSALAGAPDENVELLDAEIVNGLRNDLIGGYLGGISCALFAAPKTAGAG